MGGVADAPRFQRVLFFGRRPGHQNDLPTCDHQSLVVISDHRLAELGELVSAGYTLIVLDGILDGMASEQANRSLGAIAARPANSPIALAFNARSSISPELEVAVKANPDMLVYPKDGALTKHESLAPGTRTKAPLSDLTFLQALVTDFALPGATLLFCGFDEEFAEMEMLDPQRPTEALAHFREQGYRVSLHDREHDLEASPQDHSKVRSAATSKEIMVSLVVPLFNAERHIEETLQSVVDQNLANLELVIIDDGSTDRSPELAQGFADNFARFTYSKQANQGVSAARNHGLKLACGKYIAFLDADDLLLPGSLERRVAFLEEGSFRICGGLTQIIDDDGRSLNLVVGSRFHSGYEQADQVNCQISTLMGQSAVMKRQAFRVGQRFAEDWRYMVDLTAAGDSIGFCGDEPLSCYRWHAVSATGKEFFNHFNSCIALMEDLVLDDAGTAADGKLAEGVTPVQSSKVRTNVTSRIQTMCLHFAVLNNDSPLDPRVVTLMDSVTADFPQSILSITFENILTRAFLLPRHSDELYLKISDRAPGALKKLRALKRTAANKVFIDSFKRFVGEVNEELKVKRLKGWKAWFSRRKPG